jgi:hypothetical protein
MGHPSVADLKAALRMNLIRDVPVTTKDIEIAEKIFGPDISSLKGKTTRKKPVPVIEDYVEIPRELIAAQQNVTLCADAMKVNGLWFLTTISRNLYYRTAQHVAKRDSGVYTTAFESVMAVYNRGGFQIRRIHADNEFRPLMETMANKHGIAMNYANPQEHVPEAERNNRVIKERVRAAYYRLPYTRLPRILVMTLVSEAAKKLNFFPSKYGISKYYSPRMIVHGKQLDYNRHCRYPTGIYVQAHNEPDPKNTNAPRTLDCIYLRYNDADQGGHVCLHLATNRIITRKEVTPIPITPAVIQRVHAIADEEEMPNGLKIVSKDGTILYDSAWIAGVDYDDEAFDDEDYEYEGSDDDDDDDMDDDDDPDENENENNDNNQQNENDEMNPDDTAALEQANPTIVDNIDDNDDDDEDDDENKEEEDENEEEEEEKEEDDDDENETENEGEETRTTRSGRAVRPPRGLVQDYHLHLQAEAHQTEEYSIETARVIATVMDLLNKKMWDERDNSETKQFLQFVQTYSLTAGLRKFRERGRKAAKSEMQQLHNRIVFTPKRIEELTPEELERAMESLIFLTEKRDGTVKARTCANGSIQREYLDRDDATSPTASTESILLTATIEAKQKRDVMTADIPNAFVQTNIARKNIGERIIMKIRGPLVDILVEIAPEVYADYVTYENGRKILYVEMLKALYGMLQSSLLYYKKFRKDIESIGFVVNPYDPCVANRIVNGKQHTVTWHVDDLKSSHVDPKVNNEFLEWLQKKYGQLCEVKAKRGDRHDYLAMTLDYSTPGVVKVDMTEYVKSMVEEFPKELDGKAKFPWTEKLFKVDEKSKKLSTEQAKTFHTFVMKGMFVGKRGRQDIQPGIAYLTTRVKEPNENDWSKLVKIMNFLKRTWRCVATLEADDSQSIYWWIDAAFAVHRDYKGHTGAYMSLGKGAVTSVSTKQKVNTRSSTEAELVGINNLISKVLWTKRFLESQGFEIKLNLIYRDNTSSMKLEENGRASASKRTRHFDIKYFYVTDLIERKEISIKYCPTDEMGADYMTKPTLGSKFTKFRGRIMNLKLNPVVGQQECVDVNLYTWSPIKGTMVTSA